MSKSSPVTGAPPLQLAQFEVIRRLGAGGMAEVFLAKKRGAEGTFKLLVVKRILPTYGSSRRFRAMFVEEAQVATRLNHPNVVQVYEFYDGGEEGQLLAMEYVEGPDLGALMSSAKSKGTRVPPWVGAWVIGEAAKGLHYAHEKKDEGGAPLEIVHRDVSPQNILLSFEGAVKIADFGIASAKLFSEEAGVLKGKYGYMSPEQARAEKVDRRSDLYALGVIFWEILTARPLHGGLGGEALLDIVRSGVVEPPSTYVREIPDELEAIVMRALSEKRDARFQSGRELQTAIARALLAKQELVDALALEQAIAQLVSREATRPGSIEPPPKDDERGADMRTIAAVPAARSSSGDYLSVVRPDGTRATRDSRPPTSSRSLPPIGPREVRHVAIVTLHLDGVIEGNVAERALENLRSVLNEIAYKRNTRWQWTSAVDARAVAGLSAHATRAAADASRLALDIHEAIAGMKDDLPTPVGAAIGIVRGIASGWRDPEGNLVRYRLHDPAGYLADTLAEATPLHRTWVAGGVYRLVRREFRWGDAPTLALKSGPGLDVPPTMRIYALERSLSREEKLADVSAVAGDLVGRDTEKADLHAAYHEAVNGSGGSGIVTPRAIVGELGIGKTALVSTFLAELPPNARLIRVECSPVKQEVPFSTTAELVRDAIGTTGEEPFEEVAQLIARAGGGSAQGDASNPMVARLAELATNRQVGRGDDEDAHYRKKLVVNGVRALLAAIAMQQPLVVVIDGLQWADKSSFELLVDIIKSPDPLPILLLLVARPDERVASPLEGIVRIELRALGAEEQIRLLETRLGVREGVRAVCADLMPRVGGNPFFLLEMVDALLEKGALEIREIESDGELRPILVRGERAERDGADSLKGLPSTLEQLLADRMAELPREEHAVVDWLAIAGGPLASADLVKLARALDDEAIIRLRARAVRSQGRARRLPAPAHARRRVCRARRRRAHADAPRARRSPRVDVARARALGGDRGAPPRAGRSRRAGRRVLHRSGERRARRVPDAARDPLLPARALAHAGGRFAAAVGARRARRNLPRAGATQGAREAPGRAATRGQGAGDAARGLPRALANDALRSRRGAPVARPADREARRRAVGERGAGHGADRSRGAAERVLAGARRCAGGAGRLRPRAQRLRPASEREHTAAHAGRGAAVAREFFFAAWGACAKPWTRTWTPLPCFAASVRAARRPAPRTCWPTPCSCRGGTRTRSRWRWSRSRSISRSAGVSSSPRP